MHSPDKAAEADSTENKQACSDTGDEMIAMETMLDPARKRPAAVVRGKPAAANTKIAVIRTRPAALEL